MTLPSFFFPLASLGAPSTSVAQLTLAQLVEARLLVQMDDTPANRKFRDMVAIFAEGHATFQQFAVQIPLAFNIDNAQGAQLDIIGSIVGLTREGFDDDRYRVFLLIQTVLLLSGRRNDAEWTGTGANIIRIVRTFADDDTVTIVFLNTPPYSYVVSVSGLVINEASLLARFLKVASYAAVLGQLEIVLADDSLYDSDAVAVTDGGIWCSASVAVVPCSTWGTVITTEC